MKKGRTAMRLLQKPSCYIVPLDMEAAYLFEPTTSTRRENGFVARTGVPGKDSSYIIWSFLIDLLLRPLRITPTPFLSTLALADEFKSVKTYRLALRRLIRCTLFSL